MWAFGILAWELYASYKTGQQRRAISAPYFWLENKKVIFNAIAFGKRTLRLYTHTKVPITSSRETKPKILKEIRLYTDLYHAIENTANHDTGKPLYFRWYYTQSSHRALPSYSRRNFVGGDIFSLLLFESCQKQFLSLSSKFEVENSAVY